MVERILIDDTPEGEWDCIATGFGEYAEYLCKQEGPEAGYAHDFSDGSGYRAAFDWLAQHDREVAVRTLREAASEMALRHTEWRDMRDDDGELIVRDDYSTSLDYAEALAKSWLRAQADNIAREVTAKEES